MGRVAGVLRHPPRPFALLVVVASLFLLPVIGGVARAAGDGWTPVGDNAVIQIRTLDVGTSRTPLVGISSTVSLDRSEASNHPGPIQLWMLAPVFRVISAVTDSPSSFALAQALLNLGVLLGTLCFLAVAPISLRRFAAGTGLVLAGLWLAGPDVAFSPWNPDPAFVALLCAMALTLVTVGAPAERWRLAWIAATVSIAAQSHLAYAVPAVMVLAVAGWPARRRRLLMPAVVTVLVMWSGPIVDLFDGGGNLRRFLQGGGDGRYGLGRAWERLTQAVLPWRLGLQRAVTPQDLLHVPAWWEQAIAGLLVGLLVWCAVRGRRRREARLVVIVLLPLLCATAAMPPSLGAFLGAHVYRVWIPVVLAWWATLLAELAARRRNASVGPRVPTRLVVPASIATVVVGAAVFLSGPIGEFHRLGACSAATRSLAALVPPLEGAWVLDSSAVPLDVPVFEAQVAAGLWAELLRRGDDVVLRGRTQPAAYHPARLVDEVPAGAGVLVLTTATEPVDGAARLATVVGSASCEQPGEGTTLVLWRLDQSSP